MDREERYFVGERLGEGASFSVHRGRDRKTGRSVVIKILKEEFASDEGFCSGLLDVAERALRIDHPSLVRVLGAGRGDQRPFVVCEWRPGSGLRQKLLVEGRIEPRQALTWAAQVARTLSALHAMGEVHGDVRPEHVVICGPEGAKLRDHLLSLPFLSHPVFREYWLQRSAPYVAPEVIQGQEPSSASDIYSLGALLYEMLTGSPPFTGESTGQVLIKHFREDPPSLRRTLPSAPPELDELIRRCLSKRPSARPSAKEVAERLTEILARLRSGSSNRLASTRRSFRPRGVVDSFLMSLLRACAWTMGVFLGVGIILGLLYLAWRLTTPKEVTVPYVIGLPLTEAEGLMRQHGLRLRWAGEEYSDRYPPGTVIRTDPPPGQRVKEGREVRAIISKGAELVEVPDVVGLPLESAKREIEAAGLSVGDVSRRYDPYASLGEVVDQWPRPGAKVAKGGEVSLVVSKGPRPKEGRYASEELEPKSAEVEVLVPAGLGKQRVRIEVEDADGVRTVFDEFCSPGERVKERVDGRGRMVIRVFINEELVEEREI
ncbi:MAG TPA: serine/threonine-protein kinase [Armatimonadetes bacterium]|nr:serine/threonine-protein kinase [Armatimonadota bacterium]